MGYALKVLVVEDDRLARIVTVEALLDAGFDVSVATNADEALALCEDQTLDVLITKIQLSEHRSGWDIAEIWRENHPELPVIYVGGHSAAKPRPVPGSLTMLKPFNPDDLVGIIQQLRQSYIRYL